MDDVACDLVRVGEEDLFVFVDVLEGFAVVGDAPFFHVGTAVHGATGGAWDGHDSGGGFCGGAVELTEAADGVEGFEGESRRIDVLVAAVAGVHAAMFIELLSDGGGASDIGFDGGDIWRWWRRVFAEQMFEDPFPSEDGGGGGAVGGHFEDARLRHDSAPVSGGRESDFAEGGLGCGAGDVGWEVARWVVGLGCVEGFADAVMGCDASIGDGPVGVHELEDAPVLLKDFREEASGFLGHGPQEGSVKICIEVWVGDGGVDFPEFEPLSGEVIDEAVDERRVEEAFGLLLELGGLSEVCIEQGVVWWERGEEVGEATGDLEVVEGAWGFFKEEALGSGEDAFVSEGHGVHEGCAAIDLGVDAIDEGAGYGGVDGASEGAWDECGQEFFCVFLWGCADGFEGVIEPLVDIGACAPVGRFAAFGAGFCDGAWDEFCVTEQGLVGLGGEGVDGAFDLQPFDEEAWAGVGFDRLFGAADVPVDLEL